MAARLGNEADPIVFCLRRRFSRCSSGTPDAPFSLMIIKAVESGESLLLESRNVETLAISETVMCVETEIGPSLKV